MPTTAQVLVTVASAGSWFRLVGNMTGGNFIEQGGAVYSRLRGTNNTYGSTQLGNGGIWVEPLSSLGTGDLILSQTSTNNPTITLNNATQTISGADQYLHATRGIERKWVRAEYLTQRHSSGCDRTNDKHNIWLWIGFG